MSYDPNQQQPYGQQPQYGGQQPPPQYGGQQPPPQYGGPPQYPPQPQYGGYPPQPKRRSPLKIILIIAGVLLVLCVAGFVGIFVWGKGEIDGAKASVDKMMQAGKNNDPAAGFALFSQIAIDQGTTQEDVAAFFDNRQLFDGYESIELGNNFSVNASSDTGTIASMSGNVNYAGGSGTFTATLSKENGTWKIVRIDINRN